MKIIKLLSLLALIGSILWLITAPDYEPGIAVITSLSALVTAWCIEKKRTSQTSQSQNVAENAVGIQAGGDVNLGDMQITRKAKDVE